MVQQSEIHVFGQINVDSGLWMWYAEYVGAAAPPFLFRRIRQAKEMTLDCSFSDIVKGHFCSFLLSNIIGYLAFVKLDFFLSFVCV